MTGVIKWKGPDLLFAATGTTTTLTFTSAITNQGSSRIGVSAAAGPVIEPVKLSHS